MMQDFFSQSKKLIDQRLTLFWREQTEILSATRAGSNERVALLEPFVRQGKMLRGGLTLLAASMFGGERNKSAVSVAAAIELVHSGLLIHDDITDRDRMRRGSPTIFAAYEKIGAQQGAIDPYHYGSSLGIFSGDSVYFSALALVVEVEDPVQLRRILQLVSQHVTACCAAQMEDISLGLLPTIPLEEEILTIYRYKTAGYSFILPLQCGAVLADQNAQVLVELSSIGLKLGLLYQIKDDELGLFGEESQTGKPVGSDIEEGKKTLYYAHLMNRANQDDRLRLNRIFGSHDITADALAEVKKYLTLYGVDKAISEKLQSLEKEVLSEIELLDIASAYKLILRHLVDYSLGRQS